MRQELVNGLNRMMSKAASEKQAMMKRAAFQQNLVSFMKFDRQQFQEKRASAAVNVRKLIRNTVSK